MITNPQSGTNVQEIADGIYRISTPLDLPGGLAFTFNQYLLVDDAPLLFHTGPRQMFSAGARGRRLGHAGRSVCATSACRMSRPTNAAR